MNEPYAIAVLFAAAVGMLCLGSALGYGVWAASRRRGEDRRAEQIDRLHWQCTGAGELTLTPPDDSGLPQRLNAMIRVKTQLRQNFTVSVNGFPAERCHHVLEPSLGEWVVLPATFGVPIVPRLEFLGAISVEAMRHRVLAGYMAAHGVTSEDDVTVTLDGYDVRVLAETTSHDWVKPWVEFRPRPRSLQREELRHDAP